MGISLQRQLTAFLLSLFTGCICGVLYDGIRILRVFFGIARYTESGRRLYSVSLPLIGCLQRPATGRLRRVGRLVVLTFGDLLFSLMSACVFCVFLFHAASGCFRWFYLLGAGIGFFLYYLTVGRLIMLSSEVLVFFIRTLTRYILWLSVVPFRACRWLLIRFGRMCSRRVLVPLYALWDQRRRLRFTKRVRASLPEAVRFSENEFI